MLRLRTPPPREDAHDRSTPMTAPACCGAVLVVDDQRDFAVGLSRLLAGQFPHWSFEVRTSGAEALAELSHLLDDNAAVMTSNPKLFTDGESWSWKK